MMNDNDHAWAAGFLDGEGSFTMHKSHKRMGYLSIRALVSANQAVFQAPIQKLYDLYGGGLSERNQRTSTGKRVYEWKILGTENQGAMLEKIAPYMIVKNSYAELFLELHRYQGNKYGRAGNPYLSERLAIFDQYTAMRAEYHLIEPNDNHHHEPEPYGPCREDKDT
jgi:hypothetical protein